MPHGPVLSVSHRAFLGGMRRAILATISPGGRPRQVPICFSLHPDRAVLYTPIDEKPKRATDPLALARIRDLAADPRVGVLVDRWSDDWEGLGWLRLDGRANVLDAAETHGERAAAIAALRARYPQYTTHALEARPLIRIEIDRVTAWGELAASDDPPD